MGVDHLSAAAEIMAAIYYLKRFNEGVPKAEREKLPEETAIYRYDVACAFWMETELARRTRRSGLSAPFLFAALGGLPVKRAVDLIDQLELAEMAHALSGDSYNPAYHAKRFAESAGATVDGEIYVEEWKEREESRLEASASQA